MAFHVPYSQRHRKPPIYIGFDTPVRRRPKFNWWGFNGLWLSFASLLTCGLMSPISLLISMVGLRRRPRKMAIVGTIVSLAGIGLISSIVIGGISHEMHRKHQREMARYQRVVKKQIEEGQTILASAAKEFEQFRDEHDGRLPAPVAGNMLAIKTEDPWGKSLRYETETDYAVLRSSGPDTEFNTRDDLTLRMEGETDRQALLPIDD